MMYASPASALVYDVALIVRARQSFKKNVVFVVIARASRDLVFFIKNCYEKIDINFIDMIFPSLCFFLGSVMLL